MFEAEARQAVNSATAKHILTMIVRVKAVPDHTKLHQIENIWDRHTAAEKFFDEKKAPFLEQARQIPGVKVEDIRGSTSRDFVITAPKETWVELLKEGSFLSTEATRVILNTLSFSTS